MWTLIPQKMIPPSRTKRYCCDVLKENTGRGRFIATGVRWAESSRRKNSRGIMELNSRNREKRIILTTDNDEKRRDFESCELKGQMTVNPIVDWEDTEVWDYIHSERLPINPLYCEGWKRVGCIGCPLATRINRQREFARWPTYEKNYIAAFDRMLEARKSAGKPDEKWTSGTTGTAIFHWWMEDGVIDGQITFDEIEEYQDV